MAEPQTTMKHNTAFGVGELWCRDRTQGHLNYVYIYIYWLVVPSPNHFIPQRIWQQSGTEGAAWTWTPLDLLTFLFNLGWLSKPLGMIFELFFIDFGLRDLAWEPFGRQDTKRSEKERKITSNWRPWGTLGGRLGLCWTPLGVILISRGGFEATF